MIIDPECIAGVRAFIKAPVAFFKEANQVIASVIFGLADAGSPLDGLILYNTLVAQGKLEEVGGRDYVLAMANNTPTSANAEYYAACVQELYQRREQIRVHQVALKEAIEGDGNAEDIRNVAVEKLLEIQNHSVSLPEKAADLLAPTLDQLQKQAGPMTGLPSGFIFLDNLTGGFQNGNMIIVAARASVGKTTIAVDMLAHICFDCHQPVGILSMEMTKHELMSRLICSRGRINNAHLRTGQMSNEEKDRLGPAITEIMNSDFWIDDTPALTIPDLRGKVKDLVRKGAKIVGIDYLGLARGIGQNEQERVASVSGACKQMAKDLNIPILAIAQLNRESEREKRVPKLSDLRSSGSLEQDSDMVVLLHREAVSQRGNKEWEDANAEHINEALVILAKNRNGACDSFKLTFLPAWCKFTNFSYGV